jgi:DNA-binding cell septation regulator SpoVG
MKIEARCWPYMGPSSQGKGSEILATAQLTLDGAFVIKSLDLVVIKSTGKMLVNFPRRRTKDNRFFEYAHPITAECRAAVLDAVMAAYDAMKKTGGPTQVKEPVA